MCNILGARVRWSAGGNEIYYVVAVGLDKNAGWALLLADEQGRLYDARSYSVTLDVPTLPAVSA